MPKIVDKAKMKDDILQASLNAFLKYGFHNTTMAKIAQEAGIAKGTLYLYFDSKEALSIAFAKKHFTSLETRLMNQKSFTSLDALLEHIKKTLMVKEEDVKFIPVFFEVFGPSFHSKEFRTAIADFFNNMGLFYTKVFMDLIEKGELQTDVEPKALGRVLVSMLDGIILHYGLFSIPNISYTQMVDEALDLIKRGLLKS